MFSSTFGGISRQRTSKWSVVESLWMKGEDDDPCVTFICGTPTDLRGDVWQSASANLYFPLANSPLLQFAHYLASSEQSHYELNVVSTVDSGRWKLRSNCSGQLVNDQEIIRTLRGVLTILQSIRVQNREEHSYCRLTIPNRRAVAIDLESLRNFICICISGQYCVKHLSGYLLDGFEGMSKKIAKNSKKNRRRS